MQARYHFLIVGVGAAVYAECRMKIPVLSLPSKEMPRQADQFAVEPFEGAQPSVKPAASPHQRKREMPALALVVTLLGLALLLMVPAIIILTRMQS